MRLKPKLHPLQGEREFGEITVRSMNEHLSIDTPEQIELNYDIAGIGSRFCTALIDSILIGIITVSSWFVTRAIYLGLLTETFGYWLAAIVGIITFAIHWGYYIVFDLINNGQSPGKRMLNLRVIKEGGYPINFADSAIRNLVRIVDFLPMFYGIGIISMMFDKKWRRLGDLAAGTLVVKERTDLTPNQLIASVAKKNVLTYGHWIRLDEATDVELSTIREYLSRRGILSAERQRQLARTIGTPIAQKMGSNSEIDYNVFLEEVYALATSQRDTD